MYQKVTAVPYRLLHITVSEIDSGLDKTAKKFITPVYLYLAAKAGLDYTYLTSLGDILERGCGCVSLNKAYKKNYYDGIASVLQYLKKENIISDWKDVKGNDVVDTGQLKPQTKFYITIEDGLGDRPYALISTQEYKCLMNVAKNNWRDFSKVLCVYLYIRSKVGYDPTTNKAFHSYWTIKYENVVTALHGTYVENTIRDAFAVLKEFGLIDYTRLFVKDESHKSPYCAGTIVILTHGESEEEINARIEEAKLEARSDFYKRKSKKQFMK